jgi:hypothetical protein
LALPITSLLACGPEADEIVFELQAHSFKNSEWSTPEHLDAPINTAANEQGPTLSRDGLTLYFGSDRPGSLGFIDIWVAKRACLECPWGLPVNVGPVVNSAASESGPSLSLDGHQLFFTKTEPGTPGSQDIYVSRRADPNDDAGWESPVLLGPGVNTSAFEAGAEYVQSAEDGAANFYFNRTPAGGTADLYTAALTRQGDTRGPAMLVAELSDPIGTDQGPSIRSDGREIYFFSTRSGGLGGNDLWISTRRSVHDAWSPPVNLGAPMNSVAADQQPGLSPDARVLIFASSRVGGLGGTDLWMSIRTPSGH